MTYIGAHCKVNNKNLSKLTTINPIQNKITVHTIGTVGSLGTIQVPPYFLEEWHVLLFFKTKFLSKNLMFSLLTFIANIL